MVHPNSLYDRLEGIKPDSMLCTSISAWQHLAAIVGFLSQPACPVQTVILDSLSELHRLSLSECTDYAYMQQPDRHDPDMPDKRDYGRALAHMRKVIRFLRDLPVHFIATAAAENGENPVTGVPVALPSLVGKLAFEICGYFDAVLYLAIASKTDGTQTRVLLTQPRSTYYGKVRDEHGNVPPEMEEPSIPELWRYLQMGPNR